MFKIIEQNTKLGYKEKLEAKALAQYAKVMGITLPTGSTQRDFGRKVQEIRKSKGITQEQLAEKVGVDRSYMGFIERGERNPTLDKIEKISKALGVTIRRLFD